MMSRPLLLGRCDATRRFISITGIVLVLVHVIVHMFWRMTGHDVTVHVFRHLIMVMWLKIIFFLFLVILMMMWLLLHFSMMVFHPSLLLLLSIIIIIIVIIVVIVVVVHIFSTR